MMPHKLCWQTAQFNILEKGTDGRRDYGQCIICWCGDGPEEGGTDTCLAFLEFQTAARCQRWFFLGARSQSVRAIILLVCYFWLCVVVVFEEYIPT